MTNPTHAFDKPGRGRYYRHPVTSEEWPSITNVLDTCIAKQVSLVPWAAKVTAAKAWEMLPRLVAASRRPSEQEVLTKELKGQHKLVKDQAADLGSRVHAQAEARVIGKPIAADPETDPFVDQLLRFFADFGVDFERDIEAAEATVINRTYGYAGTGDLWVWLKLPGRRRGLYVVDYKTSSTRAVDSVYPENGMQVAAVSKAEVILLDNGEEIKPPGPITGTAILNLRQNAYAFVEMPMAGTVDDAFAGFTPMVPSTLYLHSCYLAKPRVVQKPTLKEVA